MKIKHITSLFFFFIFTQISFSQYDCREATIRPWIDGIPDDPAWVSVEWDSIWCIWEGSLQEEDGSDFQGKYKVLWLEDKLYFLVRIVDDKIYDWNINPLENYPADDGVEIFLDEDASGGIHQGDFNAWAYHLSIYRDAVDIGKSGAALFNNHVSLRINTIADTSYWEFYIKIYPDTYDEKSDNNETVQLYEGKKMGFSVAYNDNDYSPFRETMIGSHDVNDPNYPMNKNIGWITADNFDSLYLRPGMNVPPDIYTFRLFVNSNTVQQTHTLKGITNGEGNDETITITPYSYDETLISNVSINHDGHSSTGTVTFNVEQAITDTTILQLLIKDTGGTLYNGSDSTIKDIRIYMDNSVVSIEDIAKPVFQVFPNPSSGWINISSSETTLLEVFDITGTMVHSCNINSDKSEINLSHLPAGIYFAKATFTNKSTQNIKLVID